jgi:hypothetical protein
MLRANIDFSPFGPFFCTENTSPNIAVNVARATYDFIVFDSMKKLSGACKLMQTKLIRPIFLPILEGKMRLIPLFGKYLFKRFM